MVSRFTVRSSDPSATPTVLPRPTAPTTRASSSSGRSSQPGKRPVPQQEGHVHRQEAGQQPEPGVAAQGHHDGVGHPGADASPVPVPAGHADEGELDLPLGGVHPGGQQAILPRPGDELGHPPRQVASAWETIAR